MNRRFTLCLFSLCLLVCLAPLLAQEEHPNRATGERSETLYASSGQDSVNLFNGNLTYRIPVGEPIRVGPSLALGAALVYNNGGYLRRWEEKVGCLPPPPNPDPVTEDHMMGDRIFGTGWQLHFGRLVPLLRFQPRAQVCSQSSQSAFSQPLSPSDPGVESMDGVHWGYQDPDGAVHAFYDRLQEETCDITVAGCPTVQVQDCWAPSRPAGTHCFYYSHDGSYIRLDPVDPDHQSKPTVYFPDGTYRVMAFFAGRTVPALMVPSVAVLDFANISDIAVPGTPPQYHTTLIGDSHGNAISILYYGMGGAPAHPLAAYGVPTNEWDAIPYQAYPTALPSLAYRFDVTVHTYLPYVGRTDYVPEITKIHTPSSVPGGGGFLSADFTIGYTDQSPPQGIGTPQLTPTLTSVALPTMSGQTPLQFGLQYGVSGPNQGYLSAVTLPTGGRAEYDYGAVKFWTRQPDFVCTDVDVWCPGFGEDYGTGIIRKRLVRLTKTSTSGSSSTESGETTYLRSYLHDDPNGEHCSSNHLEDCRMRVDVWAPVTFGSQPLRVTRTAFAESDQYTNTALYGRPLQTDEYFVPVTTPSSATIDSAVSFRSTSFSYDFDGPRTGTLSTGRGFNHNTRESRRLVQWGTKWTRTDRSAWDGFGHWGTVKVFEGPGPYGDILLRQADETHVSNAATWVLDPVTSRTISRPAQAAFQTTPADPAGANLSTRETFSVNPSTGFANSRSVSADDGPTVDSRILTTSWTPGAASSASCAPGGLASSACANLGFPVTETASISGMRLGEPSPAGSYARNFFYTYGTLSAAYDSGTNFLTVDRDIAPTGKAFGQRGSEGRSSISGTPSLTTSLTYDLLGRVLTTTPPGEVPESVTYGAQTLTTTRTDSSGTSVNRVFFDQLGRPTVHLRSMSGTNAYSYRVSTLDAAGRMLSTSEWQPTSCSSATDPCPELLNLQASVPSGSNPVPGIPGTTWSNFDMLDRAQNTRLADGSLITDSFTGWWSQTSTRSVNQLANLNSATVLTRDSLGRVTSVTEPATTKAVYPFAAMNPTEVSYPSRHPRSPTTRSGVAMHVATPSWGAPAPRRAAAREPRTGSRGRMTPPAASCPPSGPRIRPALTAVARTRISCTTISRELGRQSTPTPRTAALLSACATTGSSRTLRRGSGITAPTSVGTPRWTSIITTAWAAASATGRWQPT